METEVNTKTLVEEKTNSNIVPLNDETISAKSAVFLMFAELMGYVSPLIEWANDMCDGKAVEPFKEKFIKIDALSIFHDMKVNFDDSLIKSYWFDFYETTLADYEKKIEDLEKDDLPF